MRLLHIRFKDEHVEIFNALIADNQADSFQEMVVKLVDFALRKKYGITEVGAWPHFRKDATYFYDYEPKKKNISQVISEPEEILIIQEEVQEAVELDLEENPLRSQIKQSQDERPEETDPDLYEDFEELEAKLVTLTNRNKWKEAYRIAEKNEDLFEEELVPFFRDYDKWIGNR